MLLLFSTPFLRVAPTKMEAADANPFKMPSEGQVFRVRDEVRRQKALERESMKYKRVYEKTTWSARIGSAKLDERDDIGLREPKADTAPLEVHLPTVDIREKDNMAMYIAKKREMGLHRMSLATKRQEIKKLDEEAERAEKRVRQQEDQLEETNDKFEAFLKHSEMEAEEARKRADTESKAKLEKMQEMKKLSAQIAQIETEKKKNEEQLATCLEFKEFLDGLTPREWFHNALSTIRCEDLRREMLDEIEADCGEADADVGDDGAELARRKAAIEARYAHRVAAVGAALEAMKPEEIKAALDEGDPDRVPMFFHEPDQILAKFVEIEEGNLFLIQTCQELEEEIEDIAQKYQKEQQEMINIAQSRKAQMEAVSQKIQVEQGKMRQLQERIDRAKETGSVSQEELKERIEEKVKVIFRTLGLGDDSNIGTLGMLTHIEMKLEEMRQAIISPTSGVDPQFVALVMRQRDKERRQQARQALLEKQRQERELRSKAALMRSQAPVKKRVGKPVMWRSRPLDRKKEEKKETVQEAGDADDEFFQ